MLSSALHWARIAEANTGSLPDKGALLSVLGLAQEAAAANGDHEAFVILMADSVAVMDSAADLGCDGADLDGMLMELAASCTPEELALAGYMKGTYDAVQ